jgi:acyl-CoA-dependent ceramide synthase
MQQLWADWPLRETTGLLKWYYLAQFAFWLQQIFVLNIEERRKDHYQMFAHHIITCALIAASYCYHMTRVGHVILCIMDVIDILLSVNPLSSNAVVCSS